MSCRRGAALLVGAVLMVAGLLPASATAEFEIKPADQGGFASSGGFDGVGPRFDAEFQTSFEPAVIQPGQDFVFTTSLSAIYPDAQDDCPASTSSHDDQYVGWFFYRVAPGQDYATEGPLEEAMLRAADPFVVNTTVVNRCPGREFADGHMTVRIPGSETATMSPGCYQSGSLNSYSYFPVNPSVGHLGTEASGTIATLRVGSGPDCADPGAGVALKAPKFHFNRNGTDRFGATCQYIDRDCSGRATLALAGRWGSGRGACAKHTKIAAGDYSLAAGAAGKVTLELSKKGSRALSKCKPRSSSHGALLLRDGPTLFKTPRTVQIKP